MLQVSRIADVATDEELFGMRYPPTPSEPAD
jgi:hypothetical protein